MKSIENAKNIKQLLILLIAAIFLVACGNKEEKPQAEVVHEEKPQEQSNDEEIETISSIQKEVALIENDDLTINLKEVKLGRSSVTDHVAIELVLINKQNKTYELLLKDLNVDGKELKSTQSWIDEDEIKPNEILSAFINGYDYEELTANEHIAGTIIYKDYEGNRNEITFSEYIND